MHDVTGQDAGQLAPTGPDDLVAQLNRASARPSLWPWAAGILAVAVFVTLVIPPIALLLLLFGLPFIIWLALWEKARRTVITFYEVDGPAAAWYEQLTSGYGTMMSLGGAWRVRESGELENTYQRKVNSGASHLISRASAFFGTTPPPVLATNISVPTVTCGADALLFLPDRLLVRSGSKWSDLMYGDLRAKVTSSRFIETGAVPRDGQQVDTTWRYVNAKGGPDKRFRDNRLLPVMLYGELELTSPGGLRWVLQCSRVDVAKWKGTILTRPSLFSTVPTAAPTQPPAPAVVRRSVAPPARQIPEQPARQRSPFAKPGGKGELFAYADLLTRQPQLTVHNGLFAIVDVETTGFSPASGDRVIEIAIARVDRHGRIEDEFATLLNPGGRDTGAVFVHGITNEAVRDAPRFQDVLGEIVARLDGCVIVAHNATFEERFLSAEFAQAGLNTGRIPALCTLWLGQQTFRTPNHKLLTLAQHAGVPMPDAHAALGDVRAVAALLPQMLDRYPEQLGYGCQPLSASSLGTPAPGLTRPRTRAAGLKRGDQGWMSSLLARLPMSAADAGDAEAERYLSCLSSALSDGRITGDEAKSLAHLAGTAGLGSAQVAALNERFLESMREAAFEDDILTETELRGLRTAAKALGVADYFDDLSPVAAAPDRARASVPAAAVPVRQKRCGNCRTPGHYRSRCPGLS
jgi:DNA polymerase III epsilon subunit-like protein